LPGFGGHLATSGFIIEPELGACDSCSSAYPREATIGGNVPYDPKSFWNEKARRAGDPLAAVCRTDPATSRNIDLVQRRLLGRSLARIDREMPLSGKRVLDYGCGVGRFAPLLERMGYRYSGVDIAEEMLVRAQELHPGGEFQRLLDGRIPHEDATFDLLLSVGVIHHNTYHQQERILDEFLRVLRPNGHVMIFEAIGEPDPENEIEFARPTGEWLAAFDKRGMSLVFFKGARYGLTRAMRDRWSRPMRRGPKSEATPQWVDEIGARFDPVVGSLLPRRYQRRAVMDFVRKG
jgi:SAM-dependent methyltransferase